MTQETLHTTDNKAGHDEPASFTFGTKAETLSRLRPLVDDALIPELYFFSLKEWAESKSDILDAIRLQFATLPLVVRSSALAEDGSECSMAGAFLSKLNVDSGNYAELVAAIDQVAQSMNDNLRDQVLVQPMVGDVAVSGVIMTYDMVHGAPYYCIDFDDETGRTDVVTSGNAGHKSLFVYREADKGMIKSSRIALFLRLAKELETICGCAALDIEFCMNKAGQLFLLQVRRMVLSCNWHPVTERRAKRQLNFVDQFIRNCSLRRDGLLGDRTVLAIMPDWNPAEIIGTTPRPLSASLYQELITKAVWCHARSAMGYRSLGDADLMVLINNHPYIDVRNSFNSFLPNQLSDTIGEKLVNAWLDRLEDYPELHDKIEFEIVSTCLDFCFDEDFKTRYPDILNKEEFEIYKSNLAELTRECLNPAPTNTLKVSLEAASKLDQLLLPNIPKNDAYSQLAKASSLLTKCRELGTLPFAVVARHAFIAETLLRSSVRRGALKDTRLVEFKRSINTVTGDMIEEYAKVCDGQLPRSYFIGKYGHLRPGTYEITSLRYDERDDLFLDDMPNLSLKEALPFKLTGDEYTSIKLLLDEAELNILSVDQFLHYAREAIAGREYVKFIFTKILSDALTMIVRWGEFHGLSRDDLSYLEWPLIAKSLICPIMDYTDRYYLDTAETARRNLAAAHSFRLGHIIFGVRDIYVATLNRSVPNFVGIGTASGSVVKLEANIPASINIRNQIVCIENADPGFDWIFTKSPSALITRFGGANSHMAVRCAEFGLPAAIGCGDQIFQQVINAGYVELNCAEEFLRPLYGK